MKLATQYTRVSMLTSLVVLLIAGGIYYFAISYIADKQFDRDLAEELGEMNEFIQQHHRLPKPFEFDSYQAKFEPVGQMMAPPRLTDTIISSGRASKPVSARAIIAIVRLDKTNYRMTIVESKETTDDLVQIIFLITILLIGLLLLALLLANRFLLRGLWQPFYHLLDRLLAFSLTGKGGNSVPETNVDEFRELQAAISAMEEKAGLEYLALKAFTENASHEMMTPIAVITSKLDNLVQDESLTEEHLAQLQDIYNAGNKLSRLGQSLLLLVKIDHQLFKDAVEVHLEPALADKVGQFAEITSKKSIVVTSKTESVIATASPYLIDILLNNLLGNAIRHNNNYGQIRINLNKERLSFANTGAPDKLDADKIFERFEKSPASEGTGLGLTIARNICEGYNWKLDYSFDNPYHTFTIRF
ncbi:sensor histidine kinase [Mucilaginibacter rubeus]|uniref:histidine kinase n=1 Tax=Mucilaginibacter rubeus TaxID=2027860 RepID=A0A5C1HXP7_9SPHI|nr:HAMP domain-containing sensor histidine kinase [Mucilaginibacter rubeus]QEM10632.1 HAMP domain-containing histidine kinase [Mucilaginibacter rubeus]